MHIMLDGWKIGESCFFLLYSVHKHTRSWRKSRRAHRLESPIRQAMENEAHRNIRICLFSIKLDGVNDIETGVNKKKDIFTVAQLNKHFFMTNWNISEPLFFY